MKTVFPLILALLFSIQASAQIGSEKESYEVFEVEKMAEYVGGSEAMNMYLVENMDYPADAIECECQGRVIVEFIVRRDGEVVDVRVVKSLIKCDPPKKVTKKKKKPQDEVNCDEAIGKIETEAVRVVSAMPDWIPAQQRGKNVNMKFRLPLSFMLN